jgi:succinate dehydrogenase / fumarate reductase cytochrome b subunit
MAQVETSRSSRERPLSPHLQVWRWHVTMFASILHRVTGVALYAGVIVLVLWLCALAAGPETFAPIDDLLRTPAGVAAFYAFVGALGFHLANGLRHLFWDAGAGFQPATAEATAWFALIGLIAAPAGFWFILNGAM